MIPYKTNQKRTKKRTKKSRSDHHNGKTTKTHREMTQSDDIHQDRPSPFFMCRQINLHRPQQMIHSQGRRKQQ